MKRWFPIFFLGLSLLANIVVHLRYANFLATWTPTSDYSNPQPIGLFALFSVPVGLIYLWRTWGSNDQNCIYTCRLRRLCGNTTLVIAVIFWVYYCIDGLVSAWVAETSSTDSLMLLQQSSQKHKLSVLSLFVGGLFALWLKGIRIPPRTPRAME